MISVPQNKRVCDKGHTFYKSSDCPTCPVCAGSTKPTHGFLSRLGGPARNALLSHGIDTLEKLSQYREKEILKFHGMGKGSLPGLCTSLEEQGLRFKP